METYLTPKQQWEALAKKSPNTFTELAIANETSTTNSTETKMKTENLTALAVAKAMELQTLDPSIGEAIQAEEDRQYTETRLGTAVVSGALKLVKEYIQTPDTEKDRKAFDKKCQKFVKKNYSHFEYRIDYQDTDDDGNPDLRDFYYTLPIGRVDGVNVNIQFYWVWDNFGGGVDIIYDKVEFKDLGIVLPEPTTSVEEAPADLTQTEASSTIDDVETETASMPQPAKETRKMEKITRNHKAVLVAEAILDLNLEDENKTTSTEIGKWLAENSDWNPAVNAKGDAVKPGKFVDSVIRKQRNKDEKEHGDADRVFAKITESSTEWCLKGIDPEDLDAEYAPKEKAPKAKKETSKKETKATAPKKAPVAKESKPEKVADTKEVEETPKPEPKVEEKETPDTDADAEVRKEFLLKMQKIIVQRFGDMANKGNLLGLSVKFNDRKIVTATVKNPKNEYETMWESLVRPKLANGKLLDAVMAMTQTDPTYLVDVAKGKKVLIETEEASKEETDVEDAQPETKEVPGSAEQIANAEVVSPETKEEETTEVKSDAVEESKEESKEAPETKEAEAQDAETDDANVEESDNPEDFLGDDDGAEKGSALLDFYSTTSDANKEAIDEFIAGLVAKEADSRRTELEAELADQQKVRDDADFEIDRIQKELAKLPKASN